MCPPDHFLDSGNVIFTERGVKTRKGTSLNVSLNNIRRMVSYKRIGEADRLLLLDASGNIWDSTSLGAPILTIVGMTDFSAVSLYNRAYITPHNGVRGLPGEKVYVYEGSGSARAAAGSAPTGVPITAVTSAATGSVEVGKRLFAVSFETSSGFITQPGPSTFTLYDGPGGKKVDLSGVLTGPPGTVARHILATKKLADTYAGDQNNQEFFFVPNARIGDNTTTIITVDFFDADLQSAADYLLDELSIIPAGVGIGVYGNRLAVWGLDAIESAVYFSYSGQPESISSTEGFILAFPGDAGGGVKNCVEYRSQFYIQKAQRTYVTAATDDNPAFWSVVAVDQSMGTEPHGIAKILDISGSALDNFLTCDRSGLYLFNGTFSNNELSFKIADIWSRINKAVFNQVELVYDPVRSLIYVAVPLDAAVRPSHVLVGDVTDGMDPKNIRWTTWTFPKKPTTIVVDVKSSDRTTLFKFGTEEHNVYTYDESVTDDFGTPINSFIETALLPPMNDESISPINHFGLLKLRAKGSGALNILVSGLERARTIQPAGFALSASPGKSLDRLINFQDERCSIKLSCIDLGANFNIFSIKLFVRSLWASREY